MAEFPGRLSVRADLLEALLPGPGKSEAKLD